MKQFACEMACFGHVPPIKADSCWESSHSPLDALKLNDVWYGNRLDSLEAEKIEDKFKECLERRSFTYIFVYF